MEIISAEIMDGCVRLNYKDGSFDIIFIGESDPAPTTRKSNESTRQD